MKLVIHLEYITTVNPQCYSYLVQLKPINIKPDILSPNELSARIYGFGKLILYYTRHWPISILSQLKPFNTLLQSFSKIYFRFFFSRQSLGALICHSFALRSPVPCRVHYVIPHLILLDLYILIFGKNPDLLIPCHVCCLEFPFP